MADEFAAAESVEMLEKSGVDVADGLNRLRGNGAVYKKLLLVLADNAEKEAARFSGAVSERAEVTAAAHKLKGSAANLGAKQLSQTAMELEYASRDESLAWEAVQAKLPDYCAECIKFASLVRGVLGD